MKISNCTKIVSALLLFGIVSLVGCQDVDSEQRAKNSDREAIQEVLLKVSSNWKPVLKGESEATHAKTISEALSSIQNIDVSECSEEFRKRWREFLNSGLEVQLALGNNLNGPEAKKMLLRMRTCWTEVKATAKEAGVELDSMIEPLIDFPNLNGTEARTAMANRNLKLFEGLVNREDMSKFEGGMATKEDVEALAAFLDDPVDGRDKSATLTLMLLDGPTINKDITAMLSKHDGKVLANLIRVLGERGATGALTSIYEKARSDDSNVRLEAFEALGKIGDKSHLDKMIELLDVAKSKTERKIIATSVANVISKSDDIDGRVGPLISALPTLKEESQVAAIPYLGNLGGSLAFLKIKDYLRSANNEIRIAAIEALGEWANSEPLGELVDQVKSEQEKSVKSAGVSAVVSLSSKPGPFPESEVIAQLIEILDTLSGREKLEILGAMAQLADDSALEFWQKSDHPQKAIAINQVKDRKEMVAKESGGVVTLSPTNALYIPVGIVRSGILEVWEFGDIGWTFSIQQPGTYSIEIDQRSNAKNRGTYTVIVGDKMIRKRVESSGREFKPVTVGNVEFDSPGIYKIVIRPNSFDENDYLMDLQEVRLKR